MRKARLKITGRDAVYHCVSRVVGGEFVLGDSERDKLQEMLWQRAEFGGLEIITYCLMSNHFHVVVRVPAEITATDAELVARATKLYGKKSFQAQTLRQTFEKKGRLPEEVRKRLRERMGDVAAFMKGLKQEFSRWFNRGRNRCGTLWAERFKSVLVEDHPAALQAMAAYVDLNPVRAGLVKDPKEYRWCGYGEAGAGSERARRGLASFHPSKQWGEVAAAYQQVLLVGSGRGGAPGNVAQPRETIRRELQKCEDLALGEVLRLRVRYFSDGVALGSPDYVNQVFEQFRDRFGPRRRSGARRMRGVGALGELSTMRDLKVNVVS